MKSFKKWLYEATYAGTDEMESKIDFLYDKAKYAVKIAQMYVQKAPGANREILKDVTTIAPLNQAVFGLYNSSENDAIIGPQMAEKIKFKFGPQDINSSKNIKKLPLSVVKQYVPDLDPKQFIPTSVIHVNVNNIVSKFGDSREAVIEIASTIVHEATHSWEYRNSNVAAGQSPKLTETNPEKAEADCRKWANDNWKIIQNSFPQLRQI
jgi:hypothetical protein